MTALAWRIERPEWVPPPALTMSVSPSVIFTDSNGTSSRSAVTWAKLVSCPCPAGCVPITTSMMFERTMRSARSLGEPIEDST